MSTSTSTDLQLKDRKKSAHWSDADTDNLMNHMDPYKYQKIHLPCYDLLSLLCPHETPRNHLRTK
ncbi:hypothetical protein EHS25_005658 [Saitozyma podzolica]|uniref:Uncharacterized protein n=1 Tax=Saitozyma podzolica TaxID=1890683 RepID=A0A427XVP2_9TREE|nr:hypothetical protein EHS25_005658 [Saitozyma podzolica]